MLLVDLNTQIVMFKRVSVYWRGVAWLASLFPFPNSWQLKTRLSACQLIRNTVVTQREGLANEIHHHSYDFYTHRKLKSIVTFQKCVIRTSVKCLPKVLFITEDYSIDRYVGTYDKHGHIVFHDINNVLLWLKY